MFAKFDQVLGKKTPTTSSGPISTRADQVRSMEVQPKEEVKSNESFYGGGKNSIGQKLINDVNEGASDYSKEGMGTKQLLGPTKAVARGVGDIAGAIFHPVGQALDKITGGKLTKVFDDIAKSAPAKGSLLDTITNSPTVQKLAMEHPNLGEDFQRVLNLLFLGSADVATKFDPTTGKSAPAEPDISTLGERTKSQIETVKNVPETIINKSSELGTKVKDKISDITKKIGDKVTGKINGKSPEEVLATPEKDVYKLPKTERDFYKQNQQEQVNQKHTEIEKKVNEELTKKNEASTKQIEDLNKEVEKTAYNKTLELKPKAVKAFGEQSKTYRALREEDMAPFKDTPLTHSEVSNVLDKTFPDNPEIAQSMKAKLDLDTNTPGWTSMTVGELDSKMMEIKGDLGAGAKKGNRVYTPEELNTDKALHGLSTLLKEKGVDLSRSNKFWSEWAPLRDKIVTKLKPFDKGGFETKTFSTILKNTGNGDIHNDNFISAFEDVLGEKITKETRTALEKLTSAEKQQLTNEADAKIKIEENKLAKKHATSKLTEKAFETERNALRRKVLWGIFGLGVDKYVKAKTGIGI